MADIHWQDHQRQRSERARGYGNVSHQGERRDGKSKDVQWVINHNIISISWILSYDNRTDMRKEGKLGWWGDIKAGSVVDEVSELGKWIWRNWKWDWSLDCSLFLFFSFSHHLPDFLLFSSLLSSTTSFSTLFSLTHSYRVCSFMHFSCKLGRVSRQPPSSCRPHLPYPLLCTKAKRSNRFPP